MSFILSRPEMIIKKIKGFVKFWLELGLFRILFGLWHAGFGHYFSSADSPRPGRLAIRIRPPALFTFLRPAAQMTFSQVLNDGITFSRSPQQQKLTFSRHLVTTKFCHVFFYFIKKNSTYSLFRSPFQQKFLSYINHSIAVWIDWLVFYGSN